jgi:hypothetical protein
MKIIYYLCLLLHMDSKQSPKFGIMEIHTLLHSFPLIFLNFFKETFSASFRFFFFIGTLTVFQIRIDY